MEISFLPKRDVNARLCEGTKRLRMVLLLSAGKQLESFPTRMLKSGLHTARDCRRTELPDTFQNEMNCRSEPKHHQIVTINTSLVSDWVTSNRFSISKSFHQRIGLNDNFLNLLHILWSDEVEKKSMSYFPFAH